MSYDGGCGRRRQLRNGFSFTASLIHGFICDFIHGLIQGNSLVNIGLWSSTLTGATRRGLGVVVIATARQCMCLWDMTSLY